MVVVITGATKGIGRAIADTLSEDGHQLALCARTEADLIKVKNEILDRGKSKLVYIQAFDIRDREAIDDFGRSVLQKFGSVDVLVNNTGVFVPGMIVDEKPETFDRVLETNLHSAYFMTKTFLPEMVKRKAGHIINLCSVASIQGTVNGGSYAISKHALLGFGKTLRAEVREFGIRVTNILPGPTWSHSWEGMDYPKHRLMDNQEVAAVIKTAIDLAPNAVMEEVVLRPVQGDL